MLFFLSQKMLIFWGMANYVSEQREPSNKGIVLVTSIQKQKSSNGLEIPIFITLLMGPTKEHDFNKSMNKLKWDVTKSLQTLSQALCGFPKLLRISRVITVILQSLHIKHQRELTRTCSQNINNPLHTLPRKIFARCWIFLLKQKFISPTKKNNNGLYKF